VSTVRGPWNKLGHDLPKWPVLLVTGQPVGPELGREICVRTAEIGPFDTLDDRLWREEVCEIFGIERPLRNGSRWATAESLDQARSELRILDLQYLTNDRINASRTYRPSGWCDWNGVIGTAGMDLGGKWPGLADLNEEWRRIAAAFPALELRAQILASSYCYDPVPDELEYIPLVAWQVGGGCSQRLRAPGAALREVVLPTHEDDIAALGESGSHRGCTYAELKEAVEQVRSAW